MTRASTREPATSQPERSNTTRVLLVEDSRAYARLLDKMLQQHVRDRFAPAHVERLSEALRRLAEGRFDVVLLDLVLPDSEGLETIRRMHAARPNVPIVVLTGTEDERLALDAIHAGAQDYLLKERADRELLARAIRYAIERNRLQVELEEAREREQRAQERRDLERLAKGSPPAAKPVPKEELVGRYKEALTGFLTPGNASVAHVTEQTAQAFFQQGLSGTEAVEIHLHAMDALIQRLDSATTKKVVDQARFLILGVLTHLVELYRKRGSDA